MSRRIALVVILASVVALATGCKSNKPKEGGDIAADEMGTFTCKDVKSDVCVGPTDRFEATVPVVHMTHRTKDLPQNGDVYVIQWIAEDVGEAAPANTVIATLNEDVTDVVAGTKNYVVNTKLTKPTEGWPVGKYRVEVKLADKPVTTARFVIE